MMQHLIGNDASIVDYQVQQTTTGVEVRYCTADGRDDDEHVSRLRTEIGGLLATAGLPAADVHLSHVDRIDRPASGKVKLFVRRPAG
jgi:hypothetical protein